MAALFYEINNSLFPADFIKCFGDVKTYDNTILFLNHLFPDFLNVAVHASEWPSGVVVLWLLVFDVNSELKSCLEHPEKGFSATDGPEIIDFFITARLVDGVDVALDQFLINLLVVEYFVVQVGEVQLVGFECDAKDTLSDATWTCGFARFQFGKHMVNVIYCKCDIS